MAGVRSYSGIVPVSSIHASYEKKTTENVIIEMFKSIKSPLSV